MFITTLNVRVQVLPAFAPPNKKKKIIKESLTLKATSRLFELHLERVQLSERVLKSLSDILVQGSNEPPKVNENVECEGKTMKCLGTFSVGAIPLSWRQSLIFAVISDSNAEDKHKSSVQFSQLLNFLVEINQNLIVEFNGEVAVFQPMSCSLATLTCLKEAFYEPTKRLFKDEMLPHLSKKMVATLLDEVISQKSHMTISQQDDSSDVASKGSIQPSDTSSNHSIASGKSIRFNSSKLGRTQSSNISEKTASRSNAHEKILIGTRKQKRPLEDAEMVRPPKRMKSSHESSPIKREKISVEKKPLLSKLTRTKSAASWRSQLILEKSMELRRKSLVTGPDDDLISCLSLSHGDSFGKLTAISTPKACEPVIEGITDLKSTEELLQFLQAAYTKVLDYDAGIMSSAQNIVRATIQYFTKQVTSQENLPNNGLVLEETYQLLNEHLLSTNATIREKYKVDKSSDVEEKKLKELQLQAVLHCEVDSSCSSLETCCDTLEKRHNEVVAMLRTMTFIKDTNFLSNFLNSLLENYHVTSPRFLYKIYDSLLYPLPTQLEYLMSPDKLEDDFPTASPRIQEKVDTSADISKIDTKEMELDQLLQLERQTRMSNKTQRSISFTQPPRMKIEVPTKKVNAPKQRRSERIASTTKAPKTNEEKDSRSKVRRSLFHDKKSPEISPSRGRVTPSKAIPTHYVLKTKQVRETPVGKQGVNRYLKKQEELVQNLDSSSTWCIEDTPEKDSDADVSLAQSSVLDISTSFYSNKHVMARFAHLEKRMTETRPQFMEQIPIQIPLSQLVNPIKSPRRRVTARMLFGSPVGPSPLKPVLTTILEEKNVKGDKKQLLTSPKSPAFRSPRRQEVAFKTPENVNPQHRDIPDKLLRVRRAILMTPSPTRKSSESAPKTPSPRKLKNGNTLQKS